MKVFKLDKMKVETFKTIQHAINYVIDNNMEQINIQLLEAELMNKQAYKSRQYNTIFLIDEYGILN